MHILMLGLGLVAPIGNLANIATSGKEIAARWEMAKSNKIANSLEFRMTSFNPEEMNMGIFKVTEGIKVKFVKKTRITAGIGLYYAAREINGTEEDEWGACSAVGITIPLVNTKNVITKCEASWNTVPGGLSFMLHMGAKFPR